MDTVGEDDIAEMPTLKEQLPVIGVLGRVAYVSDPFDGTFVSNVRRFHAAASCERYRTVRQTTIKTFSKEMKCVLENI